MVGSEEGFPELGYVEVELHSESGQEVDVELCLADIDPDIGGLARFVMATGPW
jgi:hypothetical protein